MSDREAEPIFCSECQNQVPADKARTLNGAILCPADLAARSFLERLRARRLPEHARRHGGRALQGMFTSLAALMLVVGIAFIWKEGHRTAGVAFITASVFVGFFAVLTGEVVTLLLDIFDQLRHQNHR